MGRWGWVGNNPLMSNTRPNNAAPPLRPCTKAEQYDAAVLRQNPARVNVLACVCARAFLPLNADANARMDMLVRDGCGRTEHLSTNRPTACF